MHLHHRFTRWRLCVVLGLLALGLAPGIGRGDWTGTGSPVATCDGDQGPPLLVAGQGGIYISWLDSRADSGGVYLTRLDSDGNVAPAWPTGGLRLSATSVRIPLLVSDEAGGAYVAWQATSEEIRLSHLTSSAQAAPGWPSDGYLFSSTVIGPPLIASDGRGGVLLQYGYLITHIGMTSTLRIGPGGEVIWSNRDFAADIITSDRAGGAYLATCCTGAHVQRIDSTGAIAQGWPPQGYALSPGFALVGLVCSSPTGVFATGNWGSDAPPYYSRVVVTRIGADGSNSFLWSPSGVPVTDGSSNDYDPIAVGDGTTGLLVAWTHWDPLTSIPNVWARRIDVHGNVGTPFPVAGSNAAQLPWDIVRDDSMGAYVAWSEDRSSGRGLDLYAQRIQADQPAPGWPESGLLVCQAPSTQDQARMTLDSGSPYLAWRDFRRTVTSTSASSDIFAAKLTPDATVPVQLALVSWSSTSKGLSLRWFAADGPLEVEVERCSSGSEWVGVGSVFAQSSGLYEFLDPSIRAGMRVGYRLAGADGNILCPPSWIDVPRLSSLRVRGFLRAMKDPTIAFSLASAGPARLELYDVSGRRLCRLDLGDLPAGEHATRCPISLLPGLYFCRLSQRGEAAQCRSVFLR